MGGGLVEPTKEREERREKGTKRRKEGTKEGEEKGRKRKERGSGFHGVASRQHLEHLQPYSSK